MSTTPRVSVYVRAGCHLCEDALARLDELRERAAFTLDVVDIEADDVLHARYLERIPVVALDGVELYDFVLDAEDLLARLGAPGAGGGGARSR